MTREQGPSPFPEQLELYGESYNVPTVGDVARVASDLAGPSDCAWVLQNPLLAHKYLPDDDCMYYFLGDVDPAEDAVQFVYWRNGEFTLRWCSKNAPWSDKCRAVRKIRFIKTDQTTSSGAAS